MRTKKKTVPFSSVNIILPTRWGELTDKQLLYFYFLKSEQYTDISIQTFCFLRWSGLKVITPFEKNTSVEKRIDGKKRIFLMDNEDIQYGVNQLNFLSEETPSEVVNVKRLRNYFAVNKYLQETSFQDYLICENNFQGFLVTKNKELIEQLACILYKKRNRLGKLKTIDSIHLTDIEVLAVINWWYSFKTYIAYKFDFLFSKNESTSVLDAEAAMNGMIRALTGGDVTKEKEVFQLDTWRALTELNEKAREVNELKDRYGK